MNILNLKPEEVTFDLVKKDVNYDEFGLFVRHMIHELKREGVDGFIEKYEHLLNEDIVYEEKAYMCGMLRHIGYDKSINFKADCIVLLSGDNVLYKAALFDLEDLRNLYKDALSDFKEYGILWEQVDSFADGTLW